MELIIDLKLLADQKATLINLQAKQPPKGASALHLTGLIELIDGLQDYATSKGCKDCLVIPY